MSRVVVFDEVGGPEVLRVTDDPAPSPAVGEVLVRIRAFAVNPLDVMMRSGTSPATVPLPHARLGIEGAGVIEAVGTGVLRYRVGDPVIIAAIPDSAVRGSYAEYTTLRAEQVIPWPTAFDLVDAAAVWVAFSTAFGALVEAASMNPGDEVLITAASGGVGRAAIQIAREIGAVPIAVTRDSSKVEELVTAGAASVVATDEEDLVDGVRRRTGGLGARVTFDLIRGPGRTRLLEATRIGGTLVAAGYLDPRPTPDTGDAPVTVIDYRGFDRLSDPDSLGRMADFFASRAARGGLRPAVDRVFGLEEVADAHRRFEAGLNRGRKIVVTA